MSGLWKRTALALTLATLALPAQANDYPSKSITIMPLLAAGTGLDVTVKTGRFGPYVQLGEQNGADEKPQRASIPKGFSAEGGEGAGVGGVLLTLR